jgi:hypothetical protein
MFLVFGILFVAEQRIEDACWKSFIGGICSSRITIFKEKIPGATVRKKQQFRLNSHIIKTENLKWR